MNELITTAVRASAADAIPGPVPDEFGTTKKKHWTRNGGPL